MRVTNKKWQGIAVSIEGSKHVANGIPCQDASEFLSQNNNQCFLFVADGAGSAQHSQLASKAAVCAAKVFIEEACTPGYPNTEEEWRQVLHKCATTARIAIEKLVGDDRTMRSLRTTFLVMAIDNDCAASVHIGDCAGVVVDEPGELVLLAPPENGEYINQTYFLTDSDWEDYLRINYKHGHIGCGVAFSDGLQQIALLRGIPFPGFINGVITQLRGLPRSSRAPALKQYFQNHIIGKRTDDDISFLCAWR